MSTTTRPVDPTVANGVTDLQAVDVTPSIAAEWLAQNVHNRRLSQQVVAAYAADMRNGDWQWNADTIKFANTGALLDGQHRLAAVVEADVVIRFLVARGLDPRAQDTVDNGRKRTFADVLKLRGERDPNQLASIARAVALAERAGQYGDKAGVPTVAEMTRVLDRFPELREIAPASRGVAKNVDIPASVVGYAWWMFRQIDVEDAAYFFARVGSDTDHAEGDPAYELRRATAAVARTSSRSRADNRYLLAITIKAWNAYRAGEKIGLLRWKPGGAKPERFPIAR